MITIFTPAYNRAHTLPKLYYSLLKQISRDFEWVIVDDGSTDGTEELVCGFERFERFEGFERFPIRYLKQENGGKHTAINRGLELAQGELFFIVDSDDYLTSDAVETILHDWEKVRDKNLCGISYLRGYSEDKVIGDQHTKDGEIANFVEMRYNRGIAGDKAEVWVTEIMKQFPYPKYEGERFFGESWNFIQQSEEHDMLWRNKIIYLCEYLEGGLTQSGRALRIRCPRGGRDMSFIAMGPRFSMKVRLKNAMLYVAYCCFAKMSLIEILGIEQWNLALIMLPAGWVLYRYWKYRFS